MWQRLTPLAKKAVFASLRVAVAGGFDEVTVPCLFAGILSGPDSILTYVLQSMDVPEPELRRLFDELTVRKCSPSRKPTLSVQTMRSIEDARRCAQNLREELIGVEHLFCGALMVAEIDAEPYVGRLSEYGIESLVFKAALLLERDRRADVRAIAIQKEQLRRMDVAARTVARDKSMSIQALKALSAATHLAREGGYYDAETKHLLIGLMEDRTCGAAQVAMSVGIDPEVLAHMARGVHGSTDYCHFPRGGRWSPAIMKAIEAGGIARSGRTNTENLLLGIMRTSSTPAARLLEGLGLTEAIVLEFTRPEGCSDDYPLSA